jgi:small subunit ribosomal protein S6
MQYEMLYIMSTSLNEADSETLAGQIKETITGAGGVITKDSRWGTRKLAYEIKKQTEGSYVYLEFDAPPHTPSLINELIHTRVGILRHLVFQVPKIKLVQDRIDAEKRQKELEAAQKERDDARAAEEAARARAEAAALEAASDKEPTVAATNAAGDQPAGDRSHAIDDDFDDDDVDDFDDK